MAAYGEKVAVLIEQGDNRISLKRAFATFAERLVVLADPWDVPQKFETMDLPDGGIARRAESRYGQLKSDPKDTRRLAFEKRDWKKADYASVWLEPTTVRLGPADEKKITAQEERDKCLAQARQVERERAAASAKRPD